MKIKYLGVFIALLAFLTAAISVSVAQDGGAQAPGGLPPSSPAGAFNPPQASPASNPNPLGQPISQPFSVQPQGFGISQPASGLSVAPQQQIFPQQQSPQAATASSPTFTSPQAPTATPAPEPPSSIEVAFRDALAPRTPAGGAASPGFLQQFGYSLFSASVSTFAPIQDVPVGPDYILGPGDNLRINIWGAMENAVVQTVDRNGQIFLPTVGPVRIWGLSFSQADQLIRENLSHYYRGFQTSVSMGGLRTIRLYVVGEVRQPGSFTISSLSTMINALFSAGGPVRVGSLRKIELKRNHHTVGSFDLYDFLLRGDKTSDFRLESGDTIFIPPIGPVVAIAGEVKRPAIYELNGATHISDLIEMAGGLTPQSYLKRVQVIRAKLNAEREVIDLDLTSIQGDGASPVNIELRNGDFVRIYPTDPRVYNTVTLAGVVKQPGEYELKPGMKLSDLIPKGSVLPEAYLQGIEVIRFEQDLTTKVIPVNLKDIWAGNQDQDITLRPRDQITVRTEFRGAINVTLSGEVKLPGTYTVSWGERLSSVIQRAGGFTDKAYLKGAVFTRRSVQEMQQKRLQDFIRDQEERILAEQSSSGLIPISLETERSRQFNVAQRREQMRIVASKVTFGRIVIHLDDPEKFEGSPSDLNLEDGDSLTVPQPPAQVLVMGSVRNPTAIIHKEGEDVQYYVNRAGGFSVAAEQREMYLVKADGSALTGFLRLKDVEPGDAIIVPPKTQQLGMDWGWLKDIASTLGSSAIVAALISKVF